MSQKSVNASKLQGTKENVNKINNDSLINTTNNKKKDQYTLKEIDISEYMNKIYAATGLPSAYRSEITTGNIPKLSTKPKTKTETSENLIEIE